MNNFIPKYIQSICIDEEIGRMMFELISNYDKEIYRKETNRFRSRLVGEIVLHKIFIRMSFSYLAYVGILTSALRV